MVGLWRDSSIESQRFPACQTHAIQRPATILLPTPDRARRHAIRLVLLVTALMLLVHRPIAANEPSPTGDVPGKPASVANGETTKQTAVAYDRRLDHTKLPRPVAAMIDAILLAATSGDIGDLNTAIEWNELPPAFAPGDTPDDPIEFLKSASADGEGRQMLAILAQLLSVGPARQPLGRDLENSDVYIWPYLAARPLNQLSPAETVDLYRLVPADEIARMRAAKRWTWVSPRDRRGRHLARFHAGEMSPQHTPTAVNHIPVITRFTDGGTRRSPCIQPCDATTLNARA